MQKFPVSKYIITPIIDDATYKRFCDWAEEISDFEFGDELESEKQFAYLDTLITLIEAHETKNFKFHSIELKITEVIEQALEQLNFSKKDLAKILGSNRVSEIFNGKRQLSLSQIKKLHKELHIPTDLLLGV